MLIIGCVTAVAQALSKSGAIRKKRIMSVVSLRVAEGELNVRESPSAADCPRYLQYCRMRMRLLSSIPALAASPSLCMRNFSLSNVRFPPKTAISCVDLGFL